MAKGGYPRGGFPGARGGGMNMQQLMQQAQKMQADMLKAQEELLTKSFTASAGGGVVTATVSGAKELTELTIKPECVDPDDVETLQDLVVAAVNEALRAAAEASDNEMQKATGGMKLGF